MAYKTTVQELQAKVHALALNNFQFIFQGLAQERKP